MSELLSEIHPASRLVNTNHVAKSAIFLLFIGEYLEIKNTLTTIRNKEKNTNEKSDFYVRFYPSQI